MTEPSRPAEVYSRAMVYEIIGNAPEHCPPITWVNDTQQELLLHPYGFEVTYVAEYIGQPELIKRTTLSIIGIVTEMEGDSRLVYSDVINLSEPSKFERPMPQAPWWAQEQVAGHRPKWVLP